MRRLLREHPWIPLAILFLAFVTAWVSWLWIASRYTPERVPLVDTPHAAHS